MMFPLPKVKDFLQWCDWFLGVVWWPFCSFSSSAAWAWQVLNENKIIIIRNPYHRLSLRLLPWPWPPLSPLINIFATTGRIDNLLFSSLLFTTKVVTGHSLCLFFILIIFVYSAAAHPLSSSLRPIGAVVDLLLSPIFPIYYKEGITFPSRSSRQASFNPLPLPPFPIVVVNRRLIYWCLYCIFIDPSSSAFELYMLLYTRQWSVSILINKWLKFILSQSFEDRMINAFFS